MLELVAGGNAISILIGSWIGIHTLDGLQTNRIEKAEAGTVLT